MTIKLNYFSFSPLTETAKYSPNRNQWFYLKRCSREIQNKQNSQRNCSIRLKFEQRSALELWPPVWDSLDIPLFFFWEKNFFYSYIKVSLLFKNVAKHSKQYSSIFSTFLVWRLASPYKYPTTSPQNHKIYNKSHPISHGT